MSQFSQINLMRKQYHFRPSEKGLLAWDINRLVELSKHLTPYQARVDSIQELNENYWFSRDAQPTCAKIIEHMRLMQEADLCYPIILSSDGRVMDGMHRVAKAFLEGLEFVEAVKFEETPEPDYIGRQPNDLSYD